MKIKIFIKLLSISIIILLCSCNENNNEPISDCPERETNLLGLVYRPALIKGLVKSEDDLFFHTAGKIVRYSLTEDIFEVLELEFDSKFSSGYSVQEFDLCPYDRNQMVIYVSMFAPELEKINQVVTYNWLEKSGKIEEMADFQDPNVYYSSINWLAKSSTDNNYIFFDPGSPDYNYIYNLELNNVQKIDNFEYYLESNNEQELKFYVENGVRYRMELDGKFFGFETPDGRGFGTININLGYYTIPIHDNKKPIIEVYEFNNYKIGKRIARLDIHNEHCLHAEGTSLAFIDEDHLVFSAFKEESKYVHNKNFFDLYLYNFKSDELIDTINVSRVFEFMD